MSVWSRVCQEAAYGLVAIQFLTRLPVPSMARFEPVWLDRSGAYFPLTGAIVGAISAAVWFAASQAWVAPVAAVLAVGAGIAATGAFHEDGLADTADGLGGGQTREQRLLIMKDSRIGTYGAVVLLAALGLKVACLSSLGPLDGVYALIAAHAGGRVVPVVASRFVPYAGDAVGAKVAPVMPTWPRLGFAVATGVAPFALLPGLPALAALAFGAAASALLLAKAWRSIGGHTGDVLGASEQVFETGVLLVVSGCLA